MLIAPNVEISEIKDSQLHNGQNKLVCTSPQQRTTQITSLIPRHPYISFQQHEIKQKLRTTKSEHITQASVSPTLPQVQQEHPQATKHSTQASQPPTPTQNTHKNQTSIIHPKTDVNATNSITIKQTTRSNNKMSQNNKHPPNWHDHCFV